MIIQRAAHIKTRRSLTKGTIVWTNIRVQRNIRRVLDYVLWLTTTPRHKYCNMFPTVCPSKIIQSVSGYGGNSRGSVLGRDFSFRHRIHTDFGDGVIQGIPVYL